MDNETKHKREKYQGERHPDKFADVKPFEQIKAVQDSEPRKTTNAPKPADGLADKISKSINPAMTEAKVAEKVHSAAKEKTEALKSVTEADTAAMKRPIASEDTDN